MSSRNMGEESSKVRLSAYIKSSDSFLIGCLSHLEELESDREIIYHYAYRDQSFLTSYCTQSALKYCKLALMKSKIYACTEPASAAH